MVSLVTCAHRPALFTSETASGPGQTGQLLKPVKSAAADKTVSDHVINLIS